MKQINEKLVKIKDKGIEFEHEVENKILGYIVASFGLVAGLAWNEAIKAFIESFFPMQSDTLKAKFIYAIAITVILVFISLYLAKFFKKERADKARSDENISES